MTAKSFRLLPRLRPTSLCAKPSSSSRHFHSYDHPAPPSPFPPVEATILRNTLKHIPSHGFTNTTLALGAKDAGYIDASTNLFPRGPVSVVEYYLWERRTSLKERVEALRRDGMWEGEEGERGVRDRVRMLTWERLMRNTEVVHRWQEALALLATPASLSLAVSELSSLADEILFLSGDISVDASWYTKRASLSTVYAASELYMTTDKSPEFVETREFMERRLEDGRVLGKGLGDVGQWVGFTASAAVNVLRSKGVRI